MITLLNFAYENGEITLQQKEKADRYKRETGASDETAIKDMKLLSEEKLIYLYSKLYGYDAELEPDNQDSALAQQFKRQDLQRYSFYPTEENGKIVLFNSNPGKLLYIEDLVRDKTGYKSGFKYILTTEAAVQRLIGEAFRDGEKDTLPSDFDITDDAAMGSVIYDVSEIDSSAVVNLVNKIFRDAVENGISDVHFEPQEDGFYIRYRNDGSLKIEHKLPSETARQIINRIKTMSNLDVNNSKTIQDGNCRLDLFGKHIDLRVSVIPAVNGENLVVRVLDQYRMSLDVTSIGFTEENEKEFLKIIHKPKGIILLTGPTGSGKSTSLYAALSALNLYFRAEMKSPRRDFGAIIYDEMIYIFGGSASFDTFGKSVLYENTADYDVISEIIVEKDERYNIKTNQCEEIESMREIDLGSQCVDFFGSIYIIGGWDGEYLNKVSKYIGTEYPKNIHIVTSGYNTAIDVKWDNVNGAASYNVEICGEVFQTTQNQYTFVLPQGEYRPFDIPIRVLTNKNGEYSLWSDMSFFSLNESMLDARELTYNFSLSDRLYRTGQTKWYKLSSGTPGRVHFQLSNVPADCSYIMQLRDSTGNVIAANSTEISDIYITEYNYYLTVTSVSGGSATDSFTITGDFIATEENSSIPDRMKAAFLQPSYIEDDISASGLNMKSITEYDGEQEPSSTQISDMAENQTDNSAGGAMSDEPMPEELYNGNDEQAVVPMSLQNSEQISGSLSNQNDSIQKSVTVPANLPSSTSQKLKLVIRVVPENANDEFSMEWKGSNTNYDNFLWHWDGTPERYYLTALLSRSTQNRTFSYTITYKTKASGSNGNYTVYTYMVTDNTSEEDFKSTSGNDGSSTADTVSVAVNGETTQYGKIDNPCDKDFYKVSVSANQKLCVYLESPNGKCYNVSILDHTGTSTSVDSSQYMDGWYRLSEEISWAAITTGASSRKYLIKVWSDDGEFSADHEYTLRIYRYNLSQLGNLELNDKFSDADAKITTLTSSYIGTSSKVASPVNFSIDYPMDEDIYAVQMAAGDKISVLMEMPAGYDDSYYQYRIAVCSNVSETNTSVSWTEREYNNPGSAYTKYVTFIAETAGTYYISISSLTKQYNYSMIGTLTITKTLSAQLDGNENKGNESTNDFLFTTIFTFLGYRFGVDGWTAMTNSVAGSLDNELDIDWYKYTNSSSIKNAGIYIDGTQAVKDGTSVVVLDSEHKTLLAGDSGQVVNLSPNGVYYIGVCVSDDAYSNIKNSNNYTLRIEEAFKFDGEILNMDNSGFGLQEIWFNNAENYVNLEKRIPANKIISVSFIASYLTQDGSFERPIPKAKDYIETIFLYDQSGNTVDMYGGWYDYTNMAYFKTAEEGYYTARIKFKQGVTPRQAYIGVYTTDCVAQADQFVKYDALEQYQSIQYDTPDVNNYLIVNCPEHLNNCEQLADSNHYLAKMPVNGNANIYWEHLNQYGREMKYGILLHNPLNEPVSVTVNRKSAYTGAIGRDYGAPLQIWDDYFDNLIIPDLTGIRSNSNVLTINANCSEWIYLQDIPGTNYNYGMVFNGVINLTVDGGKTLDTYAFMMDNSRAAVENAFNLYTVKGNSYSNYQDTPELYKDGNLLSGTTNGPILSTDLDLTGKDNFKLLLTGYDAPKMNAGELMPFYYNGEQVMNENKGTISNVQNFAVIYKFNVSNFTGNKVTFEFNPYTTPDYLANPESGTYVAYKLTQGSKVQCGSSVLLKKAGYSQEFDVDFNGKLIDANLPFELEVVVSGMSSLPLTVRFE